jgi:hypothetical protein
MYGSPEVTRPWYCTVLYGAITSTGDGGDVRPL